MFNRTGLAPAPNVPNPRNAGRKKSNPVGVPCLLCLGSEQQLQCPGYGSHVNYGTCRFSLVECDHFWMKCTIFYRIRIRRTALCENTDAFCALEILPDSIGLVWMSALSGFMVVISRYGSIWPARDSCRLVCSKSVFSGCT